MLDTRLPSDRNVPLRALLLSLAALAVPVIGAVTLGEELGEYGVLLWLTALIPAFLLAYYRGWKGVATALAAGMATLSLTQVVVLWMGRDIPGLLVPVVVAYLTIALAVGWVSEEFHRQRVSIQGLALTDDLTQLPNRRHAELFLEREFARGERGHTVSVVLFDLDFFKDYNDRYGHQAGDVALQRFADVLRQTTRKMNLSARLGGEEFVSVLSESDAAGAAVFAERVRMRLQETDLGKGSLTASAGVAEYDPAMEGPDELLSAADHALYQAKRDGRNVVRIFGRTADEQPSGDQPGAPGSEGATEADVDGGEALPTPEYGEEEVKKPKGPVTLLPHQITRFGEGRRALLLEPDDAIRTLVSGYLAREGFAVKEARDRTEASTLLAGEFDVAILDIALPGVLGAQVIRAVHARWPNTPVLGISGLPDPGVVAEAFKGGADRFLKKPFGMPELRSQLVDLLARRDRLGTDVHRRARFAAPSGEVKERLSSALDQLVIAVETREPLARGRSERLAALATELVEHLPQGVAFWCPPPELAALAGRLMTVGRIAIPVSLLTRAGPLSEEELSRVREAGPRGAALLEVLGQDPDIVDAVRWHGEWFDGSGHPDGLSGEAIPLLARILGLAMTIESMTRDRPHEGSTDWDSTVREIHARLGSQFDPNLLPTFESAIPSLQAICQGKPPGEP